jgi:hypothetical protein
MTEAILEQIHNKEKTIFWSLLAVLVLCAGFYMYCVNATIHNVVARQNIETESSQLTLSIGSQEFKYIGMRNGINIQLAYSLGFKDVANKTYISAVSATPSHVVAFRNN